MKAMILAAGLGTRMRPISNELPKPLLKIGDHSLIEWNLIAMHQAGIESVVINIAHHAQRMMQALGDGTRYGVKISYSYEEDGPYGTGGGILHALPLLGDQPFLLVSGDIWSDFNFATLLNHPVQEAHLVLVENPDYHPQGDFCLLENGQLSMNAPRLTYGSIAVLHPNLFASMSGGHFSLAPLLVSAIHKGRVSGELYRGQWFNVGTPQQLHELRESFARFL